MARGDLVNFSLTNRGKEELLRFMFVSSGVTYNIRVGYQIGGSGVITYTPQQSFNAFRTSPTTANPTVSLGGFLIEEPIPSNAYITRIEIMDGSSAMLVVTLTGNDRKIFTETALLYVENITINVVELN